MRQEDHLPVDFAKDPVSERFGEGIQLRTLPAHLILRCRPSNPIPPLYLSLDNLDSLVARMISEVLKEYATRGY